MVNADREDLAADILAALEATNETHPWEWSDLRAVDGARRVWVESTSTADLRYVADELIRLGWTKQ